MSSVFGNNVKISLFGQSHSEYIGAVIDGIPSGMKIDFEGLRRFMLSRAPVSNELGSGRAEKDEVSFVSGIVNGVTCGAPVCLLIKNCDARPEDYTALKSTPRPSHADITQLMKYGEYADISGGGHLSGRLTAPLCAAGFILLQLLKEKNIKIFARIKQIGDINDCEVNTADIDCSQWDELLNDEFPVLYKTAGEKMRELINQCRESGDSVGGIIECIICGAPAGLGAPVFDGIENKLSQAVFAIPAVKGIEFGSGFAGASLFGSKNNDAFTYDSESKIITETNNHGGILGGISSGMPIVFRCAIKPTPSIALMQKTVDINKKSAATITVNGRHDACIVPRAVPCVISAAALAISDFLSQ